MPSLDYYLREGEKYEGFRKAFRSYVVQMLTLAGMSEPARRADGIIALETAIAKAHWPPERSNDLKQIYNPMSRQQLNAFVQSLSGRRGSSVAVLSGVASVVVAETTAIAETARMLDTVALETWKYYCVYHFLRANAEYLPKAFDQAHFDFFSKALRDGTATARTLEARRRSAE